MSLVLHKRCRIKQVSCPVTKTCYEYEIAIFLPAVLQKNLTELFYEFVRKDGSSKNIQGMQKLTEQSTLMKFVI